MPNQVQSGTVLVQQSAILGLPGSLAAARKLFTQEERNDVVSLLAADPKAGEVMEGTGGFRKLRVAREGTGKSGGARVIYIFRSTEFPVFLITGFPEEPEGESFQERTQRAQETGRQDLRDLQKG